MTWDETERSSDETPMDVSSTSWCPVKPAWSGPLQLSSRGLKDRKARRDRLVPQAFRVRWVPVARRAAAENRGLKALLDSLDRRVPLVTLDQLALEARRDRRAMLDLPVPLALTELLALRAVKAQRVVLDHRGQRVIPELRASTVAPDRKASPERRGRKATPELPDLKDSKALRDWLAVRVSRDPKEYKASKDRRATPVTPEPKASREYKAQRAPQAPTGPQFTPSSPTTQPPLGWLRTPPSVSPSRQPGRSPRRFQSPGAPESC